MHTFTEELANETSDVCGLLGLMRRFVLTAPITADSLMPMHNKQVALDRKVLADIAVHEPKVLEAIVKEVMA